jgi:hypothetical protein
MCGKRWIAGTREYDSTLLLSDAGSFRLFENLAGLRRRVGITIDSRCAS